MKQKLREFWGSSLYKVVVYLWMLGSIGLINWVWPCVTWMWPREWDFWAEPLFCLLAFLALGSGPLLCLQCWLESPDSPRSPLQR
jgi:hypothetical protein